MMIPSFRWLHRPARNGVSAIADYALPQLGLLASAPLLLRHLGEAQLGIWMLATAATSSGALLSSSFGDAAVRFASSERERGNFAAVERILRGTLALNLCLGLVFAILLWAGAPAIARHIAHLTPALHAQCTGSLRIGAVLLLLRSVEAVYISGFRALESYAPAARISAGMRLLALAGSVVLASYGGKVTQIMLLTLLTSVLSIVALYVTLRARTGLRIASPSFDCETRSLILEFGCLTWLQALCALAFSHLDRILIGVMLGPAAVAVYGICVQAAQPVHTLAAAAFHGLFPYLSAKLASGQDLKRIIVSALRANLALSLSLSSALAFCAHPILSIWLGPTFADSSSVLLSVLAIAYGLLSLNVTAHFSLLALGQVRQVTAFNMLGGAASLLLLWPLTRRFGVAGAAWARLAYGPVTWLAYITLHHALRSRHQQPVPFIPSTLSESRG